MILFAASGAGPPQNAATQEVAGDGGPVEPALMEPEDIREGANRYTIRVTGLDWWIADDEIARVTSGFRTALVEMKQFPDTGKFSGEVSLIISDDMSEADVQRELARALEDKGKEVVVSIVQSQASVSERVVAREVEVFDGPLPPMLYEDESCPIPRVLLADTLDTDRRDRLADRDRERPRDRPAERERPPPERERPTERDRPRNPSPRPRSPPPPPRRSDWNERDRPLDRERDRDRPIDRDRWREWEPPPERDREPERHRGDRDRRGGRDWEPMRRSDSDDDLPSRRVDVGRRREEAARRPRR